MIEVFVTAIASILTNRISKIGIQVCKYTCLRSSFEDTALLPKRNIITAIIIRAEGFVWCKLSCFLVLHCRSEHQLSSQTDAIGDPTIELTVETLIGLKIIKLCFVFKEILVNCSLYTMNIMVKMKPISYYEKYKTGWYQSIIFSQWYYHDGEKSLFILLNMSCFENIGSKITMHRGFSIAMTLIVLWFINWDRFIQVSLRVSIIIIKALQPIRLNSASIFVFCTRFLWEKKRFFTKVKRWKQKGFLLTMSTRTSIFSTCIRTALSLTKTKWENKAD